MYHCRWTRVSSVSSLSTWWRGGLIKMAPFLNWTKLSTSSVTACLMSSSQRYAHLGRDSCHLLLVKKPIKIIRFIHFPLKWYFSYQHLFVTFSLKFSYYVMFLNECWLLQYSSFSCPQCLQFAPAVIKALAEGVPPHQACVSAHVCPRMYSYTHEYLSTFMFILSVETLNP